MLCAQAKESLAAVSRQLVHYMDSKGISPNEQKVHAMDVNAKWVEPQLDTVDSINIGQLDPSGTPEAAMNETTEVQDLMVSQFNHIGKLPHPLVTPGHLWNYLIHLWLSQVPFVQHVVL